MSARIPRRKNPDAPWRWQYQSADGRWTDLSSAEWSHKQPNDEREDDDEH